MNIEKTCGVCGRVITVRVDPDRYARWKAGELIQRALPELSADDRELLISGLAVIASMSYSHLMKTVEDLIEIVGEWKRIREQ